MDFPGYVKEHPVISVVLVLAALGTLAYTAVNFAQGTFVDDQGCNWAPVENPETDQAFNTVSEFEDYLEQKGATVPEDLELQVRDGVLHQKLGCVNTGGETLQ